MKAFFYAGAVLMAGAGIYGFIDLKKSRHNKEFRDLYKTEKPVAMESKQELREKANPFNKIAEAKKNDIVIKTAEPVIISGKKESKTVSKMTISPVDPVKTSTINNPDINTRTISLKKKKTLSYKLYSRAALDEQYLNKGLNQEKAKKTINNSNSQKH